MQNNPNINIRNNPNDKPNVENQQIGTITPATADEKNICIKAWPDAAVPLAFGKQSSAAIEIIGFALNTHRNRVSVGTDQKCRLVGVAHF